jgi:hypothetical protein
VGVDLDLCAILGKFDPGIWTAARDIEMWQTLQG